MTELAVEVSGMVKRGFLVLRQIPNPLCRFGFVPRDNFTDGFADFLPLLREVSADSFGRGVFQVVLRECEVEVKAFSAPLPLLFQKPPDCIKVSCPCESLCQVPNEEMEFFQPHDFVPLKFIGETQMPVNHPR